MSERADEQARLTDAERHALGCHCPRVQGERRAHPVTCVAPYVERIVAERLALVPAQREAFIPSPSLDPAWIAGWHAAIDHATYMSTRPAKTGGDPA